MISSLNISILNFKNNMLNLSPWISPDKNTGVGSQPFLSPGDLPNAGIKPRSPALQADYLPSETPVEPYKYLIKG